MGGKRAKVIDILTCTDDLSRNRRVGLALAQGLRLEDILASLGAVAEGVNTCRSTVALAERYGVEMPISRAVHRVLFEGQNPREAVIQLMTRELRFDIELLTGRLVEATRWVLKEPQLKKLALGYFGASTGAAAALAAAARVPEVSAVVSRGGRPDLAGAALADVRAATLLIVGGADREVLELNRQALAQLRCEARLDVVPHATHLFEEPGTLEKVGSLAAEWFARYLV